MISTFQLCINEYFSTHCSSNLQCKFQNMQGSKELKKQKSKRRGCKVLCCTCRLSVSSSEEAESLLSDRFPRVSSLAHAMVQERLDQMIRERDEARNKERRRSARRENTKFIVMVAVEKSSYDPREDFRESIVEMIRVNNMYKVNDLRQLLNCYISMNPEEYLGVILEVFHEEHDTTSYRREREKKNSAWHSNKFSSLLGF